MIANALKIGGACVLAFGLAACEQMAMTADAKEPMVAMADEGSARALAVEVPAALRCQRGLGSVHDPIDSATEDWWCKAIDQNYNGYAQQDRYKWSANGNQWVYDDTNYRNCYNFTDVLIIYGSIGQDGLEFVCPNFAAP